MVYVDPLVAYGWKLRGRVTLSCHMFTDGDLSELHNLAQKIGLKREWFQDKRLPHYDLTPSRRVLALRNGAVEATHRFLVETMRKR